MMENKDTNRDYQEVVRVGDQKREIIEIRIGIIFLFEICIHYFLYRDFFFALNNSVTPGILQH